MNQISILQKLLVIFLGSAALLLPPGLYGLVKFDEGVIVTGAMMVRDGAIPIRDFFSVYGPGQYYLTALLHQLFGEDLVVTRLASVVVLATLNVCLFECTRIAAGGRSAPAWTVAAVFAMVTIIARPNAGYPALAATLLLCTCALSFSAWAVRRRIGLLILASLLAGLSGIFRWDFGLYGLAALLVATLATAPRTRAELASKAAVAVLPGLLVFGVVYVPLIAISGAARWYEEVLHYSLFEFKDWRNVEYLRPAYWALAQAVARSDIADVCEASIRLLFAVTPVVVLGISCLVSLGRIWDRRDNDRAAALVIILTLTGLLLLNQMRVRPSMWQGLPAFAVSLPVAAYLWEQSLPWISKIRARRLAAAAMGVVTVAMLMTVAVADYARILKGVRIDLVLPRASGISIPATATNIRDFEEYGALIRCVQLLTSKDEAVFSGVRDTSRLVINDALLYFLAARRPATRFIEMDPGVANTQKGQREIIEAIEHERVNTIVLWDIARNEPNRTSVSNGVKLLDHHVQTMFEERRQFGSYLLLTRKAQREIPSVCR